VVLYVHSTPLDPPDTTQLLIPVLSTPCPPGVPDPPRASPWRHPAVLDWSKGGRGGSEAHPSHV
jgi:hypothetical protein